MAEATFISNNSPPRHLISSPSLSTLSASPSYPRSSPSALPLPLFSTASGYTIAGETLGLHRVPPIQPSSTSVERPGRSTALLGFTLSPATRRRRTGATRTSASPTQTLDPLAVCLDADPLLAEPIHRHRQPRGELLSLPDMVRLAFTV